MRFSGIWTRGLVPPVALVLGAGLCVPAGLAAQTPQGPGAKTPGPGCSCGRHPPGVPPDRTVTPYAGTPRDLEPYQKFSKPYYQNYTTPNIDLGAGREIPVPADIQEVRIGFLGPVAKQADQPYGLRMLHGAEMAIDEANARGGYGGKPFHLMIHDDYANWQFGAEGGQVRPTDAAIWGAPIDEAVKMIYDEKDWAIFGSISSESTHMMLRLALKAEIPIVNSASTDPTVPETYVPWYFTDIQDDRVQSYTLARRIYTGLGLKRAALLRVNNRYGRLGVEKFKDASRRLGHPLVIEQKYLPGDTDFRRELRIIRDSRVDAIVLWADQDEAAEILQEMRELGMHQRVFGSYRTLGDELLARAGPAADGFEAVYPYDPSRKDSKWTAFRQRYRAKYGEQPEQFSALAYDAMNILLESICQAGLNRARIQDALDQVYRYDGVTGPMVFDPNNKNVSPMVLGAVRDGKITYRVATMNEEPQKSVATETSAGKSDSGHTAQSPYARVAEDGVHYFGPHEAGIAKGDATLVLFGPHAAEVARAAAVRAALDSEMWRVIPIDSGQNWGVAATQLVHALEDEHGLAVVALDRDCAHLAEQLALKTFVPVVALADDRTLTSTNVPWIFRLPASAGPDEAVRLLVAAAQTSGTNPEKLRAVLASGEKLAGVRFRDTGEPSN
ncbi:MAG TPA: ABC transporter substrate-binding protein [Acidobacteriaceae bacterium]|jgi:ABC-type branched-subunit amino acid transport system substrate-binding protein|nr:ABC transporter substrate-binding protein [Acidobacteriaceae bacterium]